jgi:hypothetical protein
MPYRDLIEAQIDDVLKAGGANDVQRQDALAMLPRYLEMRDGKVIVADTHEPFGLDWVQANKAFLLPPVHEESEADSAFLSTNMTKRTALVQKVGIDEANRIAGQYGLKNIFEKRAGEASGERGDKTKSAGNPWLDESEKGEARRIAFIRSCGAKAAASMARSAGRTITGQLLRIRS